MKSYEGFSYELMKSYEVNYQLGEMAALNFIIKNDGDRNLSVKYDWTRK